MKAKKMSPINLNADLGESFGAWNMGNDSELLKVIGSANIACGFHASDPLVMQKTVISAASNHVSIGAHPGFPDLQGFGRRTMQFDPQELYSIMAYQIGALSGIAQSQNKKVTHVKPHGALNNMACEDSDMARVLVRAVKDIDRHLIFLAPALSELSKAAHEANLQVAEEIFADRAYTSKGTLVSRKLDGAVIHDPLKCLERILTMLHEGGLLTIDGDILKCDIHSICVHGDTPGAVDSATVIRDGLIANGYTPTPLNQMFSVT